VAILATPKSGVGGGRDLKLVMELGIGLYFSMWPWKRVLTEGMKLLHWPCKLC